MINKSIKEIEMYSEGILNNRKFENILLHGVSTDTRVISKDNLFIPLRGENFDGHKFINEAIKQGATASLWEEGISVPDIDFPFIIVKDTLKALQTLAKNYRISLNNLKVVAITGSNGKTSTKDIMEGILSTRYKTQKTQGNLNNHIGVPLTLLNLDERTEVSIVEMGTDGFGQISELTNIAVPDIAIITNIGASHLDLLKTKENVARAKMEILEGLDEKGFFIFNKDDDVLSTIIKEYNIGQNILSFGSKEDNYLQISLKNEDINGISFNVIENKNTISIDVPMIGRHNMYNTAASIIVARILGISYEDIQKGLYNIKKTEMRNEIIKTNKLTILNDAYKSNPSSLLAALDTLYSIDGFKHKAVVLGDMLDLGDDVVNLHKEIGPKIDSEKVDQIFTLGSLAKNIGDNACKFNKENIYHAGSKKELVDLILENIYEDSLVLIKASRSVALEDVINKLIEIE